MDHVDQSVFNQLQMRKSLEDPIYRGMWKIKLRGKELKKVPKEVYLMTELEVLDMSPERESCLYYQLRDISPSLGRLVNLRVLMLDTNELVDLPDEICLLSHLERLSLSNNHFSELPENFGRLQSLESLHVSNNEFIVFPLQLCELENLRFLDMSDNDIVRLPPTINKLESLETLLLFHNVLTALPNEICDLKQLRTLWIGDNQITSLPRDFGELKYLDWGQGHTSSSALEGNPLITPPIDVCREGVMLIAQFFEIYDKGNETRPETADTDMEPESTTAK